MSILTVNETFVLALALQAGDRLEFRAVCEAVKDGDRAHAILAKLRRHGAIEHVRYNHWRITEKGRIAIALAMAKDPKLAAALAPTEGAGS